MLVLVILRCAQSMRERSNCLGVVMLARKRLPAKSQYAGLKGGLISCRKIRHTSRRNPATP